MRRILTKKAGKAGLPPGTPVYVGERKTETTKITVFEYDAADCKEKQLESVGDCAAYKKASEVVWINIDGIHDISVIEKVGELFNIHPLVQEDIVDTNQRPKIEEYPGYLFAIVRMLYEEPKSHSIQAEQVSIILTSNIVISLQERGGDVFDPVRERLRRGKGLIRRRGSDYLAYCLVDAIVDHYFLILENVENRIMSLEDQVIDNPQPPVMQSIHGLKNDLGYLRRSLWPLREMLSRIEREQLPLIRKDTLPFFRDVYDHTLRIIEILESFHEIVSGLMDVYLTSISNRMNSIMKVLTIIATIFIPLTFIAGVYGMNFQHMPELAWRWSYPVVWGVMGLVFIVMVIFFKRKKWL